MTGRDGSARIGQQVGDYVLERMLGRGGMSTVFFARERTTGRPAALKILHSDLPDNIDADRRLEQEARAIARIDHDHVVRVHAWGQTHDGLPYLAMEYLEGASLAHLLARHKPVPVRRMLRIVDQVLSALDKAHALDIIHRDIKPDNVFLVRRDGQDDYVKMLDFGIAKLLGKQPHSLVHTVRGVVLGTPEYLPPEIAMDLPVSPATDLYAVGVILFEGLTGRLPFSGRGPGELAEHHCFTPPPRLRAFNRELPVELEKVVLRCLAKEPADRYRSALELRGALAPFMAEDDARTVVTAPVGALPEPPAHPSDLEGLERLLRNEVTRRWHDRTLPTALSRTLGELDELRQRLDGLGTELAIVADALAELSAISADEPAALAALDEEERALSARQRELRRADLEAETELADAEAAAGEVLESLLPGNHELTTDELQQVLSQRNLEPVAEQLGRSAALGPLEARRGQLIDEIEAVAQRRAAVVVRRAEVEIEHLRASARRRAERLRLEARRRRLEAERGAARRHIGHLLSQCLVDLAVAVGLS